MDSNISVYKIAQDTGVPENTVRRLRNGESKINNIRFILAEKLNEYYLEEIVMKQLVVIEGVELNLEVLAEYMDDEIREALNDTEFASNQEYIEKYIEIAREQDLTFMAVLNSKFGVDAY